MQPVSIRSTFAAESKEIIRSGKKKNKFISR